jgi:hypothetical protein
VAIRPYDIGSILLHRIRFAFQSAKNDQQAAAQRPTNQTSESQNSRVSRFIVGAAFGAGTSRECNTRRC